MMKKVWLVLPAVILVFGLAMLGCGGSSGGGGGDPTFTSDLSGKTVQLVKNEYAAGKDQSKGLQGRFQDPGMMQGNKISKGDKFKLNIRFKLDKALDSDLWIGLADVSPAVNYWKELSWGGVNNDSMYYISYTDLSSANTIIEREFILTATENASGNSVEANTLLFDNGDAWSKAPVTITFVSFTFTKVDPTSVDSGDNGEITSILYFYYREEGNSITITGVEGAGSNVIIPSQINGKSVTSIGNNAFFNCTSLTSVTIPNSVTSIGNNAFYNCASLASVNIPNSVTSIGSSAFYNCTSLASVNIPNSVTSIGDYAFYNCTSLASITVDANNPNYSSVDGILYNKAKTEIIVVPRGITGNVTIPNSVTSIGSRAFSYCTGLTSITVDANNPNYSSVDGILYNKAKTEIIVVPGGITGNVTIPNSVTSIGYDAFSQCTNLTSVTIPNSVTSIGVSAFSGCTSLTSVTIPNSVTGIGDMTFSGCTGLTSITIPDSVISVGQSAFSGCTSLTSVTFATGSNIPAANFGDYAFPEGSNVYGGDTLKNAYKDATTKAGTYTRPTNGGTWTKQP